MSQMKVEPMKTALKAADIMSQPVVSAFIKDSVQSVADLFLKKNISGVPVLGEDGYVVGVMTKTDLARYDQRRVEAFTKEKEAKWSVAKGTGEVVPERGFHLTAEDETIEQWFNPKVYWALPETPVTEAAEKMAKHHIHHLFVKAADSKDLVGVITTFDLLRCLTSLFREANA